MKKASDSTELRRLRAEHRRLQSDYDRASREVREYRGRMTKAEQETADWKRRFDLLLQKCHMEPPL